MIPCCPVLVHLGHHSLSARYVREELFRGRGAWQPAVARVGLVGELQKDTRGRGRGRRLKDGNQEVGGRGGGGKPRQGRNGVEGGGGLLMCAPGDLVFGGVRTGWIEGFGPKLVLGASGGGCGVGWRPRSAGIEVVVGRRRRYWYGEVRLAGGPETHARSRRMEERGRSDRGRCLVRRSTTGGGGIEVGQAFVASRWGYGVASASLRRCMQRGQPEG